MRTLSLETRKAMRTGDVEHPDRVDFGHITTHKSIDEAERLIEFVMNEESEDRSRDIIHVDGYRLENFNKNPVMPWCHDTRGWTQHGGLALANWSDVRVEGKSLVGKAKFVSGDIWPFAETVFQMYLHGHMKAVSVGIRALKWQWAEDRGAWAIDYLEQELVECSACLIGAHPEALVRAKADGIDVEPILEGAQHTLSRAGMRGVAVPFLEQLSRLDGARKVFDLAGHGPLFKSLTESSDPPAVDPEPPTSDTPAKDVGPRLVAACSSCGEEHELEIHQKSQGPGTHWAICKHTGDPVTLLIGGVAEPEQVQVPEPEKAVVPGQAPDKVEDTKGQDDELRLAINAMVGRGVKSGWAGITGELLFTD